MKIPLENDPFAPVELSYDQKQQLEWLANALVDETLAEYDEFVYTNNRHVDKSKWKQAMARENVKIYKRHGKGDLGGCTPQISLLPGGAEKPPHATNWKVPKVIGVGSIPGTVEELLYGILAPTKRASDVRTTYIKDEVADTRVLSSIITPTQAEPFQSLVMRWSLICQLIHKICVTPRDMVYIEASGYRTLANGEKMGYFLIHPVTMPGCGDLEHLGAIRCEVSSCFVFRDADQGAGAVEVYMRGFVTPGGTMSDGVAVFATCVSLIAAHRFMTCGQHKKIAWMIRNQYTKKQAAAAAAAGTVGGHSLFDQARRGTDTSGRNSETFQYQGRSCPVCVRSMGKLRSPVACDVCAIKVCARCVDKRKLTHVRSTGELVRVNTKVCKTCATVSARTPASLVAISEHVPRSLRHKSIESSVSISSTISNTSLRLPEDFPLYAAGGGLQSGQSSRRNQVQSVYSDQQQQYNQTHEQPAACAYAYASSVSTVSYGSLDSMDDESMSGYDSDSSCATTGPSTTTGGGGGGLPRRSSAISITGAVLEEADEDSTKHQQQQQPDDQVQLWLRMNKLRVAAEETYMLAKFNATAMMEAAALQQNQQHQQQRRPPYSTQAKTPMP